MAENNAESVADCIRNAIAEKDTLAAKSANAVRFIEDNYSWNVVMQKTIEEYHKLLSQK